MVKRNFVRGRPARPRGVHTSDRSVDNSPEPSCRGKGPALAGRLTRHCEPRGLFLNQLTLPPTEFPKIWSRPDVRVQAHNLLDQPSWPRMRMRTTRTRGFGSGLRRPTSQGTRIRRDAKHSHWSGTSLNAPSKFTLPWASLVQTSNPQLTPTSQLTFRWIRAPCLPRGSCPSLDPVSIQQSKLISLVSDSSAPCNWHGINF